MSWNSKVSWSEGMFLEPQHFQQHDRFLEKLIDARVQANTPYGWGFLTLSVDETALSLGKVGISSARGVLPDGTPFDFPFGDASPAPIDIPADVRDELVVLALPLRRNSSAEVDLGSHDADNESALTRYIAGESEVTDTIAGQALHCTLTQRAWKCFTNEFHARNLRITPSTWRSARGAFGSSGPWRCRRSRRFPAAPNC